MSQSYLWLSQNSLTFFLFNYYFKVNIDLSYCYWFLKKGLSFLNFVLKKSISLALCIWETRETDSNGSGPCFLLALALISHCLFALCSECIDRRGGEVFDHLALLLSKESKAEWPWLPTSNSSRQLSGCMWSEIPIILPFAFTLKSVKIMFSEWYTHQMRCPTFTSGGWSTLKICCYLWNNNNALFLFSWLERAY